jgi:hypothetical protein
VLVHLSRLGLAQQRDVKRKKRIFIYLHSNNNTEHLKRVKVGETSDDQLAEYKVYRFADRDSTGIETQGYEM